ncbi:MAG: class I SAM-dependent methyltransferase [Candidatus Omnitrophota bacterium]
MFLERFWRLLWDQRASNQDIVLSGGRSVRGQWQDQLDLVIADIKTKMDFNSEDVVLDIGCSGGRLAQEISPLVKSVKGVDYSQATVAKAKENTQGYPNVAIIPASADNLPFADNSFSKIVCYSVFMYLGSLKKVKQVLAEMKRVARPGCRILVGDILDQRRMPSLWSRELFKIQKGKADILQYLKENIGQHLGLHLWLDPEKLKEYAQEQGMSATVMPQKEALQLSKMMFDLLLEVNK